MQERGAVGRRMGRVSRARPARQRPAAACPRQPRHRPISSATGSGKTISAPTYYAFDYLSCHFLVLNTEEERFDGRGPVWQTMMTFVEKDLAAHAGAAPHVSLLPQAHVGTIPAMRKTGRVSRRRWESANARLLRVMRHYMMAERRGNSLYVIQSATGGGSSPQARSRPSADSTVSAYVTVRDDDVTYAVVEPEGSVWPVDVSPASFRKAIAYDVGPARRRTRGGLDRLPR